ncbi:DUF4843 domain-containing protein [Parapedobacter tibetensis]|uniref:DUF4843 domain-containing protein n=1 Tax=Parapedobacter tibetensis TaxID=2972951 RepID=UPI00214DCB77|nr:DUF4843 domain-containing protein [Parapedobacter tibetensis]
MKKILFYITAITGLCASAGCEKELMEYEGNEGVYFAVQHGQGHLSENSWPYQPYSRVDFVQLDQDEVTFLVKVMITGSVKDYDRPFLVAVNPDSTTAMLGVHYEALPEEVIIPAGEISASVPVRLKRAADLEENEHTLGLRLLPNEHFGLSFPEWDAIPSLEGGDVVPEFDASLHTLRINDFMVEPGVWPGSIQNGNRESGLWGVFTRKKFDLFVELFGVTYADFVNSETMPMVRMMVMTNEATAYLVERYNAGDPMLEDDGRLMWLGSVPWDSYIGVPWVPGS